MNSIDFFSKHLEGYLDELMQFTAVETPTGDLLQLDRAADFLMERISGLGFVERSMLPDHGPLIRIVREGTGVRVLLLGHFDTVWPMGSWPNLWRIDQGRVYGPGVYDMKEGCSSSSGCSGSWINTVSPTPTSRLSSTPTRKSVRPDPGL